MDLERIKSLIDAMAASDLAEMEFSENGWSLKLIRHASEPTPSPVPIRPAQSRPRSVSQAKGSGAGAGSPPSPADNAIVAPMFGVVYLRPGPDAPDFIRSGQTVAKGAVVCVVEAMKVFNEVRAPRDGVVAEIMVAGGQEIDAGQPLMRLQ